MQTVAEILWMIAALMAFGGMCLGAALIVKSGFLFLTARGNAQQIDEAKDILWHSVVGMAIIASAWIIIPR